MSQNQNPNPSPNNKSGRAARSFAPSPTTSLKIFLGVVWALTPPPKGDPRASVFKAAPIALPPRDRASTSLLEPRSDVDYTRLLHCVEIGNPDAAEPMTTEAALAAGSEDTGILIRDLELDFGMKERVRAVGHILPRGFSPLVAGTSIKRGLALCEELKTPAVLMISPEGEGAHGAPELLRRALARVADGSPRIVLTGALCINLRPEILV